jgi:rhamnulokinase
MHYLACDLGAESGRLMLGTLADDRLSLEELHRFPNGPVAAEQGLCWDVPHLFNELKAGLKIAAGRNLPIASISCDAWGLDYFLLDDTGALMEPTFSYRDSRNQRGMETAQAAVPWEEIYEETGIQQMPINTLNQLAAETDARRDAAAQFLPLGDGFNYLLSGVAKAEVSLASTTQLYNPRTHDWSNKLLKAIGWPREKFPELISPGTRLGPLKPELASETGLGPIEVIATCSHDTGAAVAAVPAQGTDWAYLSSGTWGLIGVELPEPIITHKSRELNFTNEIGFGNTVRLLRNCIGMWLLSECRRIWTANGHEYDYAALTQIADEAEPFTSLINPSDERFFKPDNMPEAIADFCRKNNQPEPATHGATVRCVLESLALLYAQRLKEAEELTGQSINRLHIVGGGSRNALLNQFTANACGMEIIAGPAEATALGNVLVQMIALGDLPDLKNARSLVQQSMDVESFQPEDPAAWDAAKTRFKELT